MTTFYERYKQVFDNLKTQLSVKESIKEVVLGEAVRVGELPLAIINPEPANAAPSTVAAATDVTPAFSVVVVVRETEPDDWFAEVIKVMGDVVDAVNADTTLGGAVRTCYLTGFAPGEVKFQNRIYYGGVVRFAAQYRFLKT